MQTNKKVKNGKDVFLGIDYCVLHGYACLWLIIGLFLRASLGAAFIFVDGGRFHVAVFELNNLELWE